MKIEKQNAEEQVLVQTQETESVEEKTVIPVSEVKTKYENPEIITIPIKRPVEIDGALLDEVKLDFTSMTGSQILKIDAELRSQGTSFDDLWNQTVLLKLMSRASGIIEDDLQKLHGADYLEVSFRTRNFFIQW